MSAFVIGTGDGPEPLLASCVPYLQFYDMVINVEGS
jgi:hypothetical protein